MFTAQLIGTPTVHYLLVGFLVILGVVMAAVASVPVIFAVAVVAVKLMSVLIVVGVIAGLIWFIRAS
jgi:hypothetical protein